MKNLELRRRCDQLRRAEIRFPVQTLRPAVEMHPFGRFRSGEAQLCNCQRTGVLCPLSTRTLRAKLEAMKALSEWMWRRYVRQAAARRRTERVRAKQLRQKKRNRVYFAPLPVEPKRLAAEALARRLPQKRVNRRSPWNARVMAPENLHFGLDHNGVAEFAERIRVLMAGDYPVYLDFTQVKEAGPAAALHIAAEIDRWREFRQTWRKPRVYDFNEWNPAIRRYFLDLGLFELLNVSNPPDDLPGMSKQRVLKMRQNHIIEPNDVTALRDQLHDLCGSVPNRLSFFDALSEAMSNVMHHAYQDDDPNGWPRLEGRWWMTADFDPSDATLRIAFLDQGVGIPMRLPRSGIAEWAAGIMADWGRNDDAARIQAALQYGRTSTGQLGRGKGFHDMQMFVDGHPDNWMRVLSGQGQCIYRSGKVEPRSYEKAIVGTIVQWSLVVPEAGVRHGN